MSDKKIGKDKDLSDPDPNEVMYPRRHCALYAKGHYLMGDIYDDLRRIIKADGGVFQLRDWYDADRIKEKFKSDRNPEYMFMLDFLIPIAVESLKAAGRRPGEFQNSLTSHFHYMAERGEAMIARNDAVTLTLESLLALIMAWDLNLPMKDPVTGEMYYFTLGEPDSSVLTVTDPKIARTRWMAKGAK